MGPVSTAPYNTSAVNWSSKTNAWVVIGAFTFGIFLLFMWGGVGAHLDAGLRRG